VSDSIPVSGKGAVGMSVCPIAFSLAYYSGKPCRAKFFHGCLISFLISVKIFIDNFILTDYSITGIDCTASWGIITVVKSGFQSVNPVVRLLFYYPRWEGTLIFKMLYI